jgi:hypothetical protein
MFRHCLNFIFLFRALEITLKIILEITLEITFTTLTNKMTKLAPLYFYSITHLTFLHVSVGKELHQGNTPQ